MNKQFKSIVALFTLAAVFTVSNAFAGTPTSKSVKGKKDKVTEGVISYKMEFDSDDPNVKQQLFMMKNSSMTMAFQGQKVYTQTKIGSVQNSITILDKEANKSVLLLSGMMGKKGADTTFTNEGEEETPDFEKTKETKEILGYECTKYILEDENGNQSFLWITDQIAPEIKSKNFAKGIDGFPLQMELIQPQMTMSFTATDIKTEVSKKDAKEYFNLEIPEDYEKVSFSELQSMGG